MILGRFNINYEYASLINISIIGFLSLIYEKIVNHLFFFSDFVLNKDYYSL